MSTNYYAERNFGDPSEAFSVRTRYHVGTMVREGVSSLNGTIFKSWQAWKSLILSDDITLVNEYGDEIDKSGFIAEVESTSPEVRARQYNYVKANKTNQSYLDPEGYTMSPYNYS